MTKLHVVSLPHTVVGSPEHVWCAYGAKVHRFPAMIAKHLNIETVVYAPPGSVVMGDAEVVEIAQRDLMLELIGKPVWDDRMFGLWDADKPPWPMWNKRCVDAINERYEPGDIIAPIGGSCQYPVVESFPKSISWEWGVGYKGIIDRSWVTFESNAWRSAIRGPNAAIRWTDSVVPNCYAITEFVDQPLPSEGYLLYLGRIVEEKGMAVLRAIMEARPDYEVVVAGQFPDRSILPASVRYEGIVAGDEKKELIAKAGVVVMPTTYLEPFGGVAVEAMMSGVPVVASPYGVFPETVGRIFDWSHLPSTLRGWIESIDYSLSHYHNPQERLHVRSKARSHWALGAGRHEYGRVLRFMLDTIQAKGWYELDGDPW